MSYLITYLNTIIVDEVTYPLCTMFNTIYSSSVKSDVFTLTEFNTTRTEFPLCKT